MRRVDIVTIGYYWMGYEGNPSRSNMKEGFMSSRRHGYLIALSVIVIAIMLLFKFGYIWVGIRHYADNKPVRDGTVVLVKQNGVYGAFRIKEQKLSTTDEVKYEWFYRSDGGGEFTGSNVKHGVASGIPSRTIPGKVIIFGPFSINWSGKDNGWGWIYYDRYAGEKVQKNDIGLCIAGNVDVRKVNAADPKWVYKSSPTTEVTAP